jgi:hypothetical protein
MIITGKDKSFHAEWNPTTQEYKVFKGERFIIKLFRFDLVKNYID